jgi:hypothetical protein
MMIKYFLNHSLQWKYLICSLTYFGGMRNIEGLGWDLLFHSVSFFFRVPVHASPSANFESSATCPNSIVRVTAAGGTLCSECEQCSATGQVGIGLAQAGASAVGRSATSASSGSRAGQVERLGLRRHGVQGEFVGLKSKERRAFGGAQDPLIPTCCFCGCAAQRQRRNLSEWESLLVEVLIEMRDQRNHRERERE